MFRRCHGTIDASRCSKQLNLYCGELTVQIFRRLLYNPSIIFHSFVQEGGVLSKMGSRTDSDSIWRQLAELIRLPQETLILCLVSALDVAMTIRLLTRGDLRFTESNPVAAYFLNRWGLEGMAYFKGGMTLFVCLVTQMIARKHERLARQVLGLATLIILSVVLYSVWLHFHHRHVIDVPAADSDD